MGVGALALPIPAGAVDAQLADPSVNALLAWCQYWLSTNLDAKLANLRGTSPIALSTANLFPFDPGDPRADHVHPPVPSLWIWWNGVSRRERLTLCKEYRYRELSALYVFDDRPQTAELIRRAGLMNAVDAVFHKASEAEKADGYGTGERMVDQAIGSGARDGFEYSYLGGQQGIFHFGKDRNDLTATFPCLMGKFAVRELIGPDESSEDLVDASLFILASDGETDETIAYMDRELEGPDGSEDDPP